MVQTFVKKILIDTVCIPLKTDHLSLSYPDEQIWYHIKAFVCMQV